MRLRKVLFIDRDGTIIDEPKTDFQVDSFEKFFFLPDAISALKEISGFEDYEFVMVTNQDGLGTDSFPEETFWPVQNKMLDILKGEGVEFNDILIDRSFEHENAPTRKPRTGLLTNYLDGSVDMNNSYVIGDRVTDVQLAKNLGCKSIFLGSSGITDADFVVSNWNEIIRILSPKQRTAEVQRTTNETDIQIKLNLDGTGKGEIKTGLHFFDHMLDQLAKHGGIDLFIQVKGDLQVDEHHTIEDTAIALGEAFKIALGNKKGIYRYGFLLPMDEALAQVAIDFGGRPWLVWDAEFRREKIGDMPTEMFMHFFKSFSDASASNLNIKVEGQNEHHKIEAIFKAWARAIRMAIAKDKSRSDILPSTKGAL
jgi:imidazoleglycerol-phosphate dehydratase / histidinol-phosphatase